MRRERKEEPGDGSQAIRKMRHDALARLLGSGRCPFAQKKEKPKEKTRTCIFIGNDGHQTAW